MMKYLILAETEDIGYFVEIIENFSKALEREQLFFELAFNLPTNKNRLHEEFKPFGIYEITKPFETTLQVVGGTCNGINSTYIIEIDGTFDYEYFKKSRNL